jgi:dimeric dUTPase (all-alpha-NTP-PPase superfamily)
MNLNNLFQIQKELDQKIVEKHNLQGQDLLPEKILALQVELAELANEWRGFKFWSKDQEPVTEMVCLTCDGVYFMRRHHEDGDYMEECNCNQGNTNPLLEEYVDCLHFILSIGNDLGFNTTFKPSLVKEYTTLEYFEVTFVKISEFVVHQGRKQKEFYYGEVFSHFLGLGKSLGFTWGEVEQAYLDKNKVNHARQESGY